MALPALACNSEYSTRPWVVCVTADKRLSPTARHLAHALALLATDRRVVTTLGELCEITGLLSRETIIIARNELERAGHIKVQRSGPRRIDAIVLVGEGV